MLRIKEAIIVEGIYDKMKLEQFVEAVILPTDGFSIIGDEGKKRLLRQLAEKQGLVILTDSDRAGFMIRNHIKSFIPAEYVKHAYIPEIKGKERRKSQPGKEGILGVEGMSQEIIADALLKAGCNQADNSPGPRITRLDLYSDGFYGTDCSSLRRQKMLDLLGLPSRISVNALLQYLNALYSYDEYKSIVREINSN
ncbi:MAG TPA: DUF4093 domain-containing protein [Candidatus Atribacteria bacterium]|mgnify:CR=1 FL=1|nr:DUF4093 domain-containing protein [Candidatus Atribacteria bacterium]HPT79505.1 DUF4093 domain-containing protein [Candidatus Atribacteria bacterium]